MYKYSKHAQDHFFDFPIFAFLFAWFEQYKPARDFSSVKFQENPDERYPSRMESEIKYLSEEARSHLHKFSLETAKSLAKE